MTPGWGRLVHASCLAARGNRKRGRSRPRPCGPACPEACSLKNQAMVRRERNNRNEKIRRLGPRRWKAQGGKKWLEVRRPTSGRGRLRPRFLAARGARKSRSRIGLPAPGLAASCIGPAAAWFVPKLRFRALGHRAKMNFGLLAAGRSQSAGMPRTPSASRPGGRPSNWRSLWSARHSRALCPGYHSSPGIGGTSGEPFRKASDLRGARKIRALARRSVTFGELHHRDNPLSAGT